MPSQSHFTPPPSNATQGKQTGSVSRIGYGCQLPWVAGLELATVNVGGWILKHGKRSSSGEESGEEQLIDTKIKYKTSGWDSLKWSPHPTVGVSGSEEKSPFFCGTDVQKAHLYPLNSPIVRISAASPEILDIKKGI